MKLLEFYKAALDLYRAAFDSLFRQMRAIDNSFVKSDEQDIANLLQDDRDKIEVQKKVDAMIREGRNTDTISIKNKKITISI